MPQITIDFPGDLVSAGVEYEATGEFRPPNKGEAYVSIYGDIGIATFNMDNHFIILRPKWHWPEWCTARWAMKAADEMHYLNNGEKPRQSSIGWYGSRPMIFLDGYFAFPPIPGDWRESLRENPNWRG